MLHNERLCADAGTQNCPCRLAEYGKCLVCERLSGGDCCGCEWQGICIYNEYLQNNCCILDKRQDELYRIEKMTWYEKDLVVMRISVPRGLAEKASLPGSFVFLKGPGAEGFFSFPVSVMYADHENGEIGVAIKICGPKSAAMRMLCGADRCGRRDRDAEGLAGNVEMRGIYRNGLLGVEKLLKPGKKKVLCLAKGTGLAPVVNYLCWSAGKDEVDLIIDLEKINREFAEDALARCTVSSVTYRSLPENLSWAKEENYDAIIISASDYYQQSIYVPEKKRILSNNNTMCCGEGICGACMCWSKDGMNRRACKSGIK